MHKTTLLGCFTALWLATFLSSCAEEENFPTFHARFSAALQPVHSCAELETHMRQAAFFQLQASYAANLEYALERLRRVDAEFCRYGYADFGTPILVSEEAAGANSPPGSSDSESKVSGTNNQIEEVDEADILKADDHHLYVAKGKKLLIFKSSPHATQPLELLSSAPIQGQAKRLLKVGAQLLVISFVEEYASYGKGYYFGAEDYAYEVLDPYPGSSSKTILTLFNVSNPSTPQKLRTLSLNARFETARTVDNNAILVLSQASPLWIRSYWYPDVCDGNRLASERKLRAEYVAALNKAYAELSRLPVSPGLHIEDSAPHTPRPCHNFFANPMPDGAEQTSVVRMDLSAPQAPIQSATLLSRPGEVFVSKNNVYMAVPHWQAPHISWFENWDAHSSVSLVHKFALPRGNAAPGNGAPGNAAPGNGAPDNGAADLSPDNGAADNGAPKYVASGLVKGTVLNAFSMDEDSQGLLRIATTTSSAWWLNAPRLQENVLSVLKQEGATLRLHGQLDNLAPDENIRSARFVDERAYIVTFRQVDPLFAIDLTNPASPRLLGELKIPGFSTYIHPLNNERLLTVGYDADENTGMTGGVKVQLFDISNPQAMRVVGEQPLSRYSSSAAAQTHLGFSYDAQRNLLALPVTEWSFSHYANHMDFEGVRLFHVDVEADADAVRRQGSIHHPLPSYPAYGFHTSAVLRNVFRLDSDVLYSLSNNALFASRFDVQPPQVVSSVSLP